LNSVPFVNYDFFGYLASGLVIVCAFAFIQDAQWVVAGATSPVHALLGTILVYVAGQVIATPASWFYERLLVRQILGQPEVILFNNAEAIGWKQVFFEYFEPLSPWARTTILRKAERFGIDRPGRELFHHIWSQLKDDAAIAPRLSTFLNNYGFARNMSMACLFGGLLILGDLWLGMAANPEQSFVWGWTSIALAVGLLYRYLKFYRQYTFELFMTYSKRPLENERMSRLEETPEEVTHGN
jgi:hypothetical protein